MSPQQLLEFYKTQTNIAKTLGIVQSSVFEWFDKGEIPMTRQYQIELATCGELKADLPADRLAEPPSRAAVA